MKKLVFFSFFWFSFFSKFWFRFLFKVKLTHVSNFYLPMTLCISSSANAPSRLASLDVTRPHVNQRTLETDKGTPFTDAIQETQVIPSFYLNWCIKGIVHPKIIHLALALSFQWGYYRARYNHNSSMVLFVFKEMYLMFCAYNFWFCFRANEYLHINIHCKVTANQLTVGLFIWSTVKQWFTVTLAQSMTRVWCDVGVCLSNQWQWRCLGN